jgi:large subunit ribosomal protein L21
MYAIVRAGGKQIKVEAGDVVDVERLPGAPGEQITLAEVLLVGGAEGASARVGKPLVPGVRVRATVQGESKGPKVLMYKYRRRKRYRLRRGHRQGYTTLRIDAIEG